MFFSYRLGSESLFFSCSILWRWVVEEAEREELGQVLGV